MFDGLPPPQFPNLTALSIWDMDGTFQELQMPLQSPLAS